MDARKIVGWNLRKFRVAKGLSQERLALEAGIDRSYIGRVERGSENVTITTLELIAAVLQTSVASLLQEPERDAPAPKSLSSGRKRQAERT
ncbi:XRE family transcriptional regulator [Mesorhizobium sp. LSJC265A00]|uniref:helix-turn-helix domain-containing protein n=1 Tax=Mesorhizobium sp. LSJC265A00 TaxID=1287322 RepID=UPI0003CEB97C|nr:helix-turn-helix transcriptional regulator [Mesorhizobium sp. LSJC265A00]ESX09919.1 XRE family transcriptional regulator [Mesorhizobium sp. LSJC265A00]